MKDRTIRLLAINPCIYLVDCTNKFHISRNGTMEMGYIINGKFFIMYTSVSHVTLQSSNFSGVLGQV